MRHPQDALLIIFALIELARDHKGTPTKDHATELANQHGLEPIEIHHQLEDRSEAQCWDEDCG
ncbi:hypothetical protein SAMN04489842_4127 [Natronobacterium texcoconense]|uniref:Uncharacterized protein n=1 Tax=Natronobacterium texcoconense TaxID=1095778 RepID=A0A1H1J5K3_NATTX|nr:hypothetical protein SAMN04489842_4127 [Natronobacterium texcoconense]